MRSPVRSLVLAALLGAPVALGVVALAPSSARATTVRDQSIFQMSQRAERVVVGRVTDVKTWLDTSRGARVFTEATVVVDSAIKGDAEPKVLHLRQLGGTAGEGTQRRSQYIPGSPIWTKGESVVLFLEHTDTGRLVTSGLAMGKYALSPDVHGRIIARRDAHDMVRIHGRMRPERFFVGAPQSEDVLPLDDLKRLVRGESLPRVFPKVVRPVRDTDAQSAAENVPPALGAGQQGVR